MESSPIAPSPELLRVLERSRDLGFLGPGSIDSHVEHTANFVAPLEERRRVMDLGSGGGVPGLVLALALPDLQMALLDAMQKRCRFLDWAVEELGLADRVRVVCARAEIAARDAELRGGYDAVVSRSFAPPAVTAECAAGFLSGAGARLIVSEPPDAAERWPAEPLVELGLAVGDRIRSSAGSVQILEATSLCPDRYPRRTGIPSKRPLF